MSTRWLRSGALVVSLAACCLAPATGRGQETGGASAPTIDASGATEPLPLALLDLENASGDPALAPWKPVLRWLLARRLGETRALRLPGRQSILAALHADGLDASRRVDPVVARRVGEVLEAQRVVQGSFTREGDRWTASVLVHPVASDVEPGAIEVTGSSPLELTERLAVEVFSLLEIRPTDAELARARRGPTTSMRALDLYVRSTGVPGGAPTGSREAWDEAVRNLQEAVKVDGRFVAAGARLSRLLQGVGQHDLAAGIARQAVGIDPQDPEAVLALAQALLAQREVQEAEKVFVQARRLRPHDVEALGRLGHIYLGTGRPQPARDVLRTLARADPTSAPARVLLARAHLMLKERDEALAAADDALRIVHEDPATVQGCVQIYEALNDVPRAIKACERLVDLLAKPGGDEQALASVRRRMQRHRQALVPRFVRVKTPRSYSAQELDAALREKLDDAEIALVVRPLESSDAIAEWAAELTAGARSDLQRARAIFDGLTRRVQTVSGGRTRTALEVFAAWSDPEELFNCQEFAKLYVALARHVALDAYYVHLERDHAGDVVDHACGGVVIDGKALLADPAYRWFGVRHASFRFLDDLQVVAHQLFQLPGSPGGVDRCRVAIKLDPESAWGRARLATALLFAGREDEAVAAVEQVERREPGRWDTLALRGILAGRGNRFEAAEAHFRRALFLYPRNATLHQSLASVLGEQGRLIEARDELRIALRLGLGGDEESGARHRVIQIGRKIRQFTTPLMGRLLEAKRRAARQREIGVFGELSRLEIVGVETYTPAEIIASLRRSPFALTGLHPRAPRDDALRLIEREIRRGFVAGGFPAAEVIAAIDEKRQRLSVRVKEAERVPIGPVRVTGNSAVSAEEIVALLSKPVGQGRVDGEKPSEPLWGTRGFASFSDTTTERAERSVRSLYGERGYREAQVDVAVVRHPDGTASLDVRVLNEGAAFRLGDVTFLGRHSDDPAELRERLGLHQDQIADARIGARIGSRLQALGRYHEVRTRELPGGREGVIDLEVFLVQAAFAPPLSRPPAEIRSTLEKSIEWLASPEAWTEDLAVNYSSENEAPAGDRPAQEAVEIEAVLGRDGFGFRVRMTRKGESRLGLIFVARGKEALVAVPAMGLRSRLRLDVEIPLNVVLEPGGPDDENTWSLRTGFGARIGQKAAIRLSRILSPLGLTALIERSLRWEREGKRLKLIYVVESTGREIPLGAADVDTGIVRFATELESDGAHVSVRTRAGALDRLVRAARGADGDSPPDAPPGEIRFSELVARSLSKFVPLLTAGFATGDEPSGFAFARLSELFLRDDGYVVRALDAVTDLEVWRTNESASGESFQIPVKREWIDVWTRNPLAFFGQFAATMLSPHLPLDSWPRTLLVEAVCLRSGQSRFTDREVVRLLNSPEVGPVGHWVVAEAAGLASQDDLARRFAERALALLTVDGFRRELDLVTMVLPAFLDDLGSRVKDVTEADVKEALRAAGADGLAPELRDFRTLIEKRGVREPRELGAGLLEFLWRRRLEALLRTRLETRWPGLVPVVAASSGRDEEIELSKDPARLRKHYLERGIALEKESKLEEAAEHFRLALQIQADDHRLHERLGSLLLRLEREDLAFEELRQALALQKSCAETRGLLAALITPLLTEGAAKDIDRARFYLRRLAAEVGDSDRDVELLRLFADFRVEIDARRLETALALCERAGPGPEAAPRVQELIAEINRRAAPDLLSYASIDARLAETATILGGDSRWRFLRGVQEPSEGNDWTAAGCDDTSWNTGRGRFGYGEPGLDTERGDMKGAYTTLYLRSTFDVSDPSRFEVVRLVVQVDDGVVVWVNGREVGRVHAGEKGSRLAHDAVATAVATEPLAEHRFSVPADRLRSGRNVVALQGLNSSLNESSDFVLEATVEAEPAVDGPQDEKRLEAFRKVATGPSASRRVAYFEGRVLQRAGEHVRAVELFRKLHEADPQSRAPLERLAESLRATGEAAEAKRLLERT